jgi:hypothetical protein
MQQNSNIEIPGRNSLLHAISGLTRDSTGYLPANALKGLIINIIHF